MNLSRPCLHSTLWDSSSPWLACPGSHSVSSWKNPASTGDWGKNFGRRLPTTCQSTENEMPKSRICDHMNPSSCTRGIRQGGPKVKGMPCYMKQRKRGREKWAYTTTKKWREVIARNLMGGIHQGNMLVACQRRHAQARDIHGPLHIPGRRKLVVVVFLHGMALRGKQRQCSLEITATPRGLQTKFIKCI